MTKEQLKNFFKRGKIPTESNFSDLINYMGSENIGIRNIKGFNVWVIYMYDDSSSIPVFFIRSTSTGELNEWTEGTLEFASINNNNAQEFIKSLDVNNIFLASDDSVFNQYIQIEGQLIWCKLWPIENKIEPMQVTIFCNLSDNKPYNLIFKLAYINADEKILIPVEYLALRRNTGNVSIADVTPYAIKPGINPLIIKELWDNIKTMQGYKDGYIVYLGVYDDVVNLISYFE